MLNFNVILPDYFPSFYSPTLVRTVETGYITTKIYPTFYKHNVIEFSIPSQWGDCLFDIYRSESDAGPWGKITETPIIGPFYKDKDVHEFSKFGSVWYLVECRLPDGRRVQSLPNTWQNKRHTWVELRAKEIQRRETIFLEKFVGVKSFLFKKKYWGTRCPECWDFQTEKATKDHCSSCLGTSFKGGYFPGFETLFQYEATGTDGVYEERGLIEPETMQAWTVCYPEINNHDLILRVPDWKIYRVESIQNTELQTKVVRQIATLIELSKESIEFELAKQAMPEEYT